MIIKAILFLLLQFSTIIYAQNIPNEWESIKKKHFKTYLKYLEESKATVLKDIHDYSDDQYNGVYFYSLELESLKNDHDLSSPDIKKALRELVASYNKYYKEFEKFKSKDYCRVFNTNHNNGFKITRLFDINLLYLYLESDGSKEFKKAFEENYKNVLEISDCVITPLSTLLLLSTIKQYHFAAKEVKVKLPPINKDRVLRPYSTYLALQYFQTQKYLIDLQEELESKREIKNNKLLSALHKSHEKLPSVFNFKETNTLVLKLHLEVKKKYEKKKFNFKQFQFLEKSYLKQFKEKLSKALVTNTLDTFVKKNPNALGLFFISSIFTISPPQDELDRVLDELKTIK